MPGDLLHQRQFRRQAFVQRAGCPVPHDFEGPVQGGGGNGAQRRHHGHGKIAAVIFQRRQYGRHAGGGKCMVDQRALRRQGKRRQRFGEGGDDRNAIRGDGGREFGQARLAAKVGGEADMHRIRPGYAGAGEGQKHAHSTRQAGEEIGGADVREQGDGGFRHRKSGVFGGDAVAAVHRNADAAAQAQPVDQRDIGFREIRDGVVECVFGGEKRPDGGGFAGHALGADGPHIAAGAKGPAAGRLDHYGVDGRVIGKVIQRDVDQLHHGQIQRVQRFRPVQLYPPHAPVPPRIYHFIHVFGPPLTRRAAHAKFCHA